MINKTYLDTTYITVVNTVVKQVFLEYYTTSVLWGQNNCC